MKVPEENCFSRQLINKMPKEEFFVKRVEPKITEVLLCFFSDHSFHEVHQNAACKGNLCEVNSLRELP